jgi:diaminopimelate decarboxylase
MKANPKHLLPPPFTKSEIEKLSKGVPTPFHVYDERGIRQTARDLTSAFSWVQGFRNYFAVKALPNPSILSILRKEGMGADCSSFPELVIAEAVGLNGEEIMFTSNDTPDDEFVYARQLGAIINLDDITHIGALERALSDVSLTLPEICCFRFNPGAERKGNQFIGDPQEAKYGLRRDQLFESYRIMRDKGIERFGLHTMVVSNMLNLEYLIETGKMLFGLVKDIEEEVGIKFEFVNLGGGIGIPYKPEDKPVDLKMFSEGIKKAYDEAGMGDRKNPVRVIMESGRFVTGPHGWLVTRVRHVAEKYKNFVGVDACMANLMRPALYDAYHHITVLGKEDAPRDHQYNVTGSLCENNDQFAKERSLPEIEAGDILAIHNTGAHGHAMGFQYNGKLRSAEMLLTEEGNFRMIRRAENPKDYFATLSGFEEASFLN